MENGKMVIKKEKVFSWKNGDKYDGEFKVNLREGQGIYYYNNGDKYEGEWKNNEKDGKGIMYYNNGDRFEGKWKPYLNLKIFI